MGFRAIKSPFRTNKCLMTRREHPGNKERSCIPLPFSRLAADDEMSEAVWPQYGAWWMLSRWADRRLPCRHPTPDHSACPQRPGSWLVEVMAPCLSQAVRSGLFQVLWLHREPLIKQGLELQQHETRSGLHFGPGLCLPLRWLESGLRPARGPWPRTFLTEAAQKVLEDSSGVLGRLLPRVR